MVSRIPSSSGLLEASAPDWASRMLGRLLNFFVWQNPTIPTTLWAVAQAGLPPAAKWTGAQVWVTDKGKVAVSNGTAWVTTDGAAL